MEPWCWAGFDTVTKARGGPGWSGNLIHLLGVGEGEQEPGLWGTCCRCARVQRCQAVEERQATGHLVTGSREFCRWDTETEEDQGATSGQDWSPSPR